MCSMEIAAVLGIVQDGQNIHFAEVKQRTYALKSMNFLQESCSRAGQIIGRDQFFAIVDFVDMLPPAAE